MLRTDNGSVLEYSTNINYKMGGKTCYKGTKARCRDGVSELEQMRDLHRKNACAVHSCVPMKKCMAKVGMHDSNGNFLTQEFIGTNTTPNLRVGGNQIGYVYQEKSFADSDALFEALRNNDVNHNVATKLAEHNSSLYGKDTTWDGQASGYFCVKCPPKSKPCPTAKPCKKADPFNAPIGLGSDVIEARENLRDTFNGRVFQSREATPSQTQIPVVMGEMLPPMPTKAEIREARREGVPLSEIGKEDSKGSGLGMRERDGL